MHFQRWHGGTWSDLHESTSEVLGDQATQAPLSLEITCRPTEISEPQQDTGGYFLYIEVQAAVLAFERTSSFQWHHLAVFHTAVSATRRKRAGSPPAPQLPVSLPGHRGVQGKAVTGWSRSHQGLLLRRIWLMLPTAHLPPRRHHQHLPASGAHSRRSLAKGSSEQMPFQQGGPTDNICWKGWPSNSIIVFTECYHEPRSVPSAADVKAAFWQRVHSKRVTLRVHAITVFIS